MRYLLIFCLLLAGCTSDLKDSSGNNCEDFKTLFDESYFYLAKYQEMVYLEILNETDTIKIKKLRIFQLHQLFTLRDKTVKRLQNSGNESDLINIYDDFKIDCLSLTPSKHRGRFIKYSNQLIEINDKSNCYSFSHMRLAVYLAIEEAIHLNLVDINM